MHEGQEHPAERSVNQYPPDFALEVTVTVESEEMLAEQGEVGVEHEIPPISVEMVPESTPEAPPVFVTVIESLDFTTRDIGEDNPEEPLRSSTATAVIE